MNIDIPRSSAVGTTLTSVVVCGVPTDALISSGHVDDIIHGAIDRLQMAMHDVVVSDGHRRDSKTYGTKISVKEGDMHFAFDVEVICLEKMDRFGMRAALRAFREDIIALLEDYVDLTDDDPQPVAAALHQIVSEMASV